MSRQGRDTTKYENGTPRPLDRELFFQLKEKAYPFLNQGRLGDWSHTLRVVEFGKALAEAEGGDQEVLLAALVLHDIGWSQVDFSDFVEAPIFQKKDTRSVQEHMAQGARKAREILTELEFPTEKTELVLRIIAHHDQPEVIQSMPEIEAAVVFEADRLDRFGPESRKRYDEMFGSEYQENAREFLAYGAKVWFRTPTGQRMVKDLLTQCPLGSEDT
jgi:HD superfamily phosphodiesterase